MKSVTSLSKRFRVSLTLLTALVALPLGSAFQSAQAKPKSSAPAYGYRAKRSKQQKHYNKRSRQDYRRDRNDDRDRDDRDDDRDDYRGRYRNNTRRNDRNTARPNRRNSRFDDRRNNDTTNRVRDLLGL